MKDAPVISGAHKTMLTMEILHATIVLVVVIAATMLDAFAASSVSSDLLSFVYGGAIAYAGGRAASNRQPLTRATDQPTNGNGSNV